MRFGEMGYLLREIFAILSLEIRDHETAVCLRMGFVACEFRFEDHFQNFTFEIR